MSTLTLPSHSKQYLQEVIEIASCLNHETLEKAVHLLLSVRAREGRLFFLGVGGSAANCSHAVSDFRKIGDFECYTPTDNVFELTARTNDEGWATTYEEWLKGCRLKSQDLVVVLSVGGGDEKNNVSPNLVSALRYAKSIGAPIVGIVSGSGGYTAEVADLAVLIPTINPAHRTAHAEGFQSVLLHLLISHPSIALRSMKWESLGCEANLRVANK